MDVDISKLILKIYNTENNSNLIDFLSNTSSTLIGAFFGAWGAYLFNIRQDNNNQKEQEKALMIKLLYDINIYAKTLCYYYGNISSILESFLHKSDPFITPIQINSIAINLEKYGFITVNSPKLYEILTYAFEDIKSIIDDQNHYIYMDENGANNNQLIEQLEEMKRMTIKGLAKMYVCLFNKY